MVRDEQGQPYTVRYEAVNAMLLNEFLKEHRKVEAQDGRIVQLEATVAELKSALEEQTRVLQKVGAKLQTSQSAPCVVSAGE